MENIDRPRELLDDLIRLSQAGRERYIRTLSPENVNKVLCLALQDMDSLPTKTRDSSIYTTKPSNSHASHGDEQLFLDSVSQRDSNPHEKSLKRRHCYYEEGLFGQDIKNATQLSPFPVRDEDSIPRSRKTVARSNTRPLRTLLPMPPPPPKPPILQFQPILTKDNYLQNPTHTSAAPRPVGADDRNSGNTLPFMILIPGVDGQDTLQDINQLPILVRDTLTNRFNATWTSTKARRNNYRNICDRPDLHLGSESCVYYFLTSDSIHSRAEGSHSQGGVHRKSADDQCIKHKNPCGHVVEDISKGPAIFFVPLPEKLRLGKTWDDLHFWVRPGLPQISQSWADGYSSTRLGIKVEETEQTMWRKENN